MKSAYLFFKFRPFSTAYMCEDILRRFLKSRIILFYILKNYIFLRLKNVEIISSILPIIITIIVSSFFFWVLSFFFKPQKLFHLLWAYCANNSHSPSPTSQICLFIWCDNAHYSIVNLYDSSFRLYYKR